MRDIATLCVSGLNEMEYKEYKVSRDFKTAKTPRSSTPKRRRRRPLPFTRLAIRIFADNPAISSVSLLATQPHRQRVPAVGGPQVIAKPPTPERPFNNLHAVRLPINRDLM